MTPIADKAPEMPNTAGNAQFQFSMELGTFIPYKLATKVGIIKIIEMEVSCFMTTFRLFEITDAKASIIPA
jgi:hypothetical protein